MKAKRETLFFTSAKASVGEEEIYLFDYPNRNEGEENFVLFFTSAKASVYDELKGRNYNKK